MDDGPKIDLLERGRPRDGEPQEMDRRLFMQLLVFECGSELGPAEALRNLAAALADQKANYVLYQDLNNPLGIGVLTWSEEPEDFTQRIRPVFSSPGCAKLRPLPSFSMFGRTYSSGFEPDLRFWLLDRPHSTVLNPAWPWAIWYPLRRRGSFERLEGRERGQILHEHAEIGKAYGAQDLAHDVRLACHGLDINDNDFVIGLIGAQLYPLSHVVAAMRKTRQTSEFIESLGPFFIGHRVAQSDRPLAEPSE